MKATIRMTRRRWSIVGGVVVLVLLALSVTTCRSAIPVEVAEVRLDTLRVVVQEEGRTRARDRYLVAAPVSGRLQRIDMREGEVVAAGEVLARLSPAPEDTRSRAVTRAQLEAAEARRAQLAAEAERAGAAAVQARREAERREELAAAGALSREQMEQARLQASTAGRAAEAAAAAVEAAAADVRGMRAMLEGSDPGRGGPGVPVTAPSAGRVLRVLEESERVVPAGTPLLEIAGATGLEVVVDVLSADAVRITSGDPVLVDEWGGDRTLRGRVRLVEPAAFTEVSALGVEEQRVNVIADLVDLPPELGAGFRVEVTVVVWEGIDVPTVPTSALFQQGGAWHLFVVDGGRARLRRVELGQRSADAAEVLEGVAVGEEVIVFPSSEVRDGVRVARR